MQSATPDCSPATCSRRSFRTSADVSPRVRTTSRRNAVLRDLDSTITSRAVGVTIFIGIAGDPPPDPKSNQAIGGRGNSRDARSGSTNRRSRLCEEAPSSGRAVRLTFAFQRASRVQYSLRSRISSSLNEMDTASKRASNRSMKRSDLTGWAENAQQNSKEPPPRPA